jgi:methylated-DNA-[protein]-cysteine S-methyltransferase
MLVSVEQRFARTQLHTPFGELTVVASDVGLRYVMFENDAHPKSFANMNVVDDAKHNVVATAVEQLNEYIHGDRISFDLPLDLVGTEFQVQAWRALAAIPFGSTASYAQQAASIGRPTATRAIGAANGRNPVVVVLPCHRVIGADGSLTGFGGGLPVKKWLLQHESDVLSHRATARD